MQFASIVAAVSAGAFLFVTGCNTAKLTPQDAGDASCANLLEYPCKAGPAGSAGCQPNAAASDPLEARIDQDASYPNGCTVIIPELVPDESGQCIIKGSCNCEASDAGDAGPPTWVCGE